MSEIKINCSSGHVADISDLRESQGDLAVLTAAARDKLKAALIEHGICAPFAVWWDGSHGNLLDGHARLRVLKDLRGDGYSIPFVPVSYVSAVNREQAMRILLSLRSDFHVTSVDGLNGFLQSMDIDVGSIEDTVNFHGIDLNFLDGEDTPGTDQPEALPKLPKKCPECGCIIG